MRPRSIILLIQLRVNWLLREVSDDQNTTILCLIDELRSVRRWPWFVRIDATLKHLHLED